MDYRLQLTPCTDLSQTELQPWSTLMIHKQEDTGNQDAGEQKGSALQSLSSGTTQAGFPAPSSARWGKASQMFVQHHEKLFSIGRCVFYTGEKRHSLAVTSPATSRGLWAAAGTPGSELDAFFPAHLGGCPPAHTPSADCNAKKANRSSALQVRLLFSIPVKGKGWAGPSLTCGVVPSTDMWSIWSGQRAPGRSDCRWLGPREISVQERNQEGRVRPHTSCESQGRLGSI